MKEILNIIIPIIMSIESGGHKDPLNAEGDYWGGKFHSLGCMQISKAVVDDCNRVQKETQFTYDDRKDKEKSFEMCRIYLTYWINRYEKNTSKQATLEDYFKCWNGGCHWYKKTKPKTLENLNDYWNKAQKRMEEI